MGSLNSLNRPEEEIRQAWIRKMVRDLHYPRHLFAIEKELSGLPHLQMRSDLPKRRADIIVFGKEIHPDYPLFPLLMIECKAVVLTPKFAQQVIGYNSYVEAPFVAIANADDLLLGHFDPVAGLYRFERGLCNYPSLLNAVQQKHNLVSII